MRPLGLKKGLQSVIKNIPDVQVLLPGFKIEYYNQERPAVLGRFGKTMSGESIVADFKHYEDNFYNNLDSLSKAAFSKSYKEDLFQV